MVTLFIFSIGSLMHESKEETTVNPTTLSKRSHAGTNFAIV